MAPRRVLTIARAEEMKAALWNFQTEFEVASEFGVSQPFVNGVKNGRTYFEARWPDGSQGALPSSRLSQLPPRRGVTPSTKIDQAEKWLKEKGWWPPPGGVSPAKWQRIAAEMITFEETREKKLEEAIASAQEAELQRITDTNNSAYNEEYDRVVTEQRRRLIEDIDPDVVGAMTWDMIVDKYPDNRLVVEAELTENDRMKRAIRVALKAVPPSVGLDSPHFADVVKTLMEKGNAPA